jgi:microcystin-dependent protein
LYIWDGTVPLPENTFATADDRNAAIPSPLEGYTCYVAEFKTMQVYNGSEWLDLATPAHLDAAAQVGIGASAPTSAEALLWANGSQLSIKDPSAGWVPVGPEEVVVGAVQPTNGAEVWIDTSAGENSGMPTGSVIPFAANSAPAGWLLCRGQAVSRTTYAGLFSVIGTIWGVGDGSTTFNLPNIVAGRAVVGTDLSDTDFAFGATGGAKTNTHNHFTLFSNDGTAFYSTASNAAPRTRVTTVSRGSTSAVAASGSTRQDSTFDETINVMNPFISMPYIIKT